MTLGCVTTSFSLLFSILTLLTEACSKKRRKKKGKNLDKRKKRISIENYNHTFQSIADSLYGNEFQT